MPSETAKKAIDSLRQRNLNVKKNAGNSDLMSAVAVAKEKKIEQLQKNSKKKRLVKAAKVLAKIVILLLVNAAILFIGAYIFLRLESYNEIENCISARREYLALLDASVDRMTLDAEKLHGEEIREQDITEIGDAYQIYVRDFAKSLVKVGYNPTHNCTNLGGNASWTFSSSVLFALTVITTIGYGVIAPATEHGRLFCMAYAVIGIPIYLLALASIGDVLAKLFKKGYWYVCCCGCCKKKQKPLTLLSSANSDIEEDRNRRSGSKFNVAAQNKDNSGNGDGETEELDVSNITVPLSFSIFIILASVLVGGIMFVAVEKEWKFLDAFYFSFITISTIGFGDVVPEIDLAIEGHTGKLALMVFYITVGMAAISMSFQLMADELYAKFAWISEKCGLTKISADDESADDDQPAGFQLSRSSTFAKSSTRLNLRSSMTRVKTQVRRPSPATSRRLQLNAKR